MTLELDLDKVKMNHHAKYLGQVHLVQKLSSGPTLTHTGPTALPEPLTCKYGAINATAVERVKLKLGETVGTCVADTVLKPNSITLAGSEPAPN